MSDVTVVLPTHAGAEPTLQSLRRHGGVVLTLHGRLVQDLPREVQMGEELELVVGAISDTINFRWPEPRAAQAPARDGPRRKTDR